MKQDIYARSTTLNYPIGFVVVKDEREFVYSRVGSGIHGVPAAWATRVRMGYGVSSAIRAVPVEDSVVAVAGVPGSRYLAVTAIAAFAANYFQGGMIRFDGASYGISYRIKSHPASLAPGDIVVLTLADFIGDAIALGEGCCLFESKYADVRSPRQEAIEVVPTMNAGRDSFLGMPMCQGLAGEYIWVQRKGPTFIISAGGADGVAQADRCMVWNQDGSVVPLGTIVGASQSYQIAGYLIPATQTAAVVPQVGAASPDALDYIDLVC